MNEGRGKLFGESIGKVDEVDVKGDGSGWGKCLRVSIEMDLTKPLARGRTICVKGEKLWISLRYEKLLRICFDCGCIVHGNQGCKGETKGHNQYGSWLRAGLRIKKYESGGMGNNNAYNKGDRGGSSTEGIEGRCVRWEQGE